jgi:hypothetical protein
MFVVSNHLELLSMLYGKLLRDILRLIYLITAPACVVAFVFSTCCFISHILRPADPLRGKITSIASKFQRDNRCKRDWQPLTLFNGYFFIASKPILKGESIPADSLERESWEFKEPAERGVKLTKQVVVHSVAAKNIAKDQFITAADLLQNESQQDSPNLDATVKTASDETHMPAIWSASAFLLLALGLCAYAYGVITLHILAFKKSLVWGLSSVFIPLATAVFKLQNWRYSRRFFHLTLVGCCLMSIAVQMLIADFRQPLNW